MKVNWSTQVDVPTGKKILTCSNGSHYVAVDITAVKNLKFTKKTMLEVLERESSTKA